MRRIVRDLKIRLRRVVIFKERDRALTKQDNPFAAGHDVAGNGQDERTNSRYVSK